MRSILRNFAAIAAGALIILASASVPVHADARGDAAATPGRKGQVRAVEPPAGSSNAAASAPRDQAVGAAVGTTLAVLLLLLVARAIRGRGDLVVALDYPPECKGTFAVRLARRRPKPRAVKAGAQPAEPVADAPRTSTRLAHTLVTRETQFRQVAARRWFVIVDGVLQDPQDETTVARCLETRDVRVARGRTMRTEIVLRPTHCRVELRILWEGKPIGQAQIGLRSDPSSLRFSRDGVRHFALEPGFHGVRIGARDRVVERQIEVASFRPLQLAVDLVSEAGLVFSGCPSAVSPYLTGDLVGAARALEQAGQTQLAHRLNAEHHASRQEHEAAATHFEAAGDFPAAARRFAELGQTSRAAMLYRRAGDTTRAAELHRAAGELVPAGEAYEAAGDFGAAARCYREAGDDDRLLGALEKSGAHFEAATLAGERRDWTRAARLLQLVTPRDAEYAAACRLLAQSYGAQGKHELAAHKMDESVALTGTDELPLEVLEAYAEQLERVGRVEQAVELLEQVRQRDSGRPHVDTRISEFRKKVSAQRVAQLAVLRAESGPPPFPDGGRYEILEQIGRGGMGVVYRARDKRLDRIVAVKRLPENLRESPKAVELLLREARSAAKLNHPNIVHVYDVDHEDGLYFITMEYLEGSSLNLLLRRRGRLSPRDVSVLGIQTSAGLQYAHDQGIVHRDVKTSNLFLTKDRTLKVMDFGIAKMMAEVRRSSTLIGGTPDYMAPEQSLGGAVDARADLYALGVTLFELVTGTVPFSDGDVAMHHRHTAAPDPRERATGVPDPLAELVLELLAKRPEDRPARAADVGARLRAVLETLPAR